KMLDGYYKAVIAESLAQGADYLLETEAYEFIYDESDNSVKGVKARNVVTGQEYIINAKAVIMGCGGFGNNPELMDSLLDPRWAGLHKNLGFGADTGLMMQAALDIGAGTWNADMSPIIMHLGLPHYLDKYPINIDESRLVGRTGRYGTWTLDDVPLGIALRGDSLAVDIQGRRFGNESKLMSFAPDIKGQSFCSYITGPFFYSLFTQKQVDEITQNGFTTIPRWEGYVSRGGVPNELPIPEMEEIIDYAMEANMVWKADSLSELAKQLDIDPTTLEETVKKYNDMCTSGTDGEFNKEKEYLQPYSDGPFYAVKIMNVAFSTIGGLDVDPQIRVLKDDHQTPINGLYAIGNDSGGVLLTPENNYTVFPGIAQGWNQTSGRLAGEYASQYINEAYGFAEVTGVLMEIDSHTV
ncbi:MAG: FAD-binding protein, partial [Raoultibacter sp.]